ncbi:MAG: hypothetical protein KKC84_01675 [Candidatus Omnitrophica bacterium]|nr:hypothetical protein [Candidatus Omnitrophota bacterium]
MSSYKIGLVPEKYTTDKNNPFNIIVKVSGGGSVVNAKLTAYSDLNVMLAKYEENKREDSYNYVADQFFFGLSTASFKKREGFDQFPTPALRCEFGHDYDIARLRVKAFSVGDHIVTFVFSHTPDGINWYSDRLEFKFHVNTVMERWGLSIALCGLLISLLGFIFRQEVINLIRFIF